MQKRMQRRDGTMMSLAASKRANELQKDMNAWEENRLMTSGEGAQLMLLGWAARLLWLLAVCAVHLCVGSRCLVGRAAGLLTSAICTLGCQPIPCVPLGELRDMSCCGPPCGQTVALASLSLPWPSPGVVRAREVDMDADLDADVRVLLLVHDTRPPFLDGRFLFTKQRGAQGNAALGRAAARIAMPQLREVAVRCLDLGAVGTPRQSIQGCWMSGFRSVMLLRLCSKVSYSSVSIGGCRLSSFGA
jgi:hypothetical protein